MTCPTFALATAVLPLELSSFLTRGSAVENGISLAPSSLYTWGLLIGGPVLMLAGLLLVKITYTRTRFFTLEYGNSSFFDRAKSIAHFIMLGAVLLLLGGVGAQQGWRSLDYSVTLTAKGLTETERGETIRYDWTEVKDASERIKATEFWIAFAKDGRQCRVQFQQRYLGETLQDQAIAITENALSSVHVLRQRP